MEMIILLITLGLLAIGSIIVLAIIVYNQMLMVNEINKRLLLIAQEAQEKERITMAELQEALKQNFDNDAPVPPKPVQEENFNPFEYDAKPKEENDL